MAIALLLWLVMWPAPAHAQGARPTGLRFMDDVAYQSIPLAVPPLLGQVPKAGTHDPRRLQRRPGRLQGHELLGHAVGQRGLRLDQLRLFSQTVREAYVAQDVVTVAPPPIEPAPIPRPVPAPSPTPTPTPVKPAPLLAPIAQLGRPTYVHDVTVPSPRGPVPGMEIFVPGEILNAQGQVVHVEVKFNFANGPPLYANAKESVFRDFAGLVATGTGARTVGTAREALGATPIVIPYYALNFQPTGYQRHYDLTFIALVYLGQPDAQQSVPIDFGFRW